MNNIFIQKRKAFTVKTGKQLLALFVFGVMLISLSACGGTPSNTNKSQPVGKVILYEIKNVSDIPCVLDRSLEPDYFDDLDAIGVPDFMVESGDSMMGKFDAEASIQNGTVTELSPSTYTFTIILAAGALPPDILAEALDVGWSDDFKVHAVTITGTYGEYAVIEWDGVSFKQVR